MMPTVDLEKAIANARELGYLVTTPNVTRQQHRWLKIAQQERFPFVAVLITAHPDGRGGISGGIRLMWDVTHLPPHVAKTAHGLMELEHLTHPGTETVVHPMSGAIGTLPLKDAKTLAAKIAALHRPDAAPLKWMAA